MTDDETGSDYSFFPASAITSKKKDGHLRIARVFSSAVQVAIPARTLIISIRACIEAVRLLVVYRAGLSTIRRLHPARTGAGIGILRWLQDLLLRTLDNEPVHTGHESTCK
jgi:hypothetical protein